MEREFKEIAEHVVAQMREQLGVELKYDKASIEWLDGYIERIRLELKKESYPKVATALGAYLGESIIATYGGAWASFDEMGQWGISFGGRSGVFPFSKVYKQLENGSEDSILSLFTVLPVIFNQEKSE